MGIFVWKEFYKKKSCSHVVMQVVRRKTLLGSPLLSIKHRLIKLSQFTWTPTGWCETDTENAKKEYDLYVTP